MMEEEIWKWWEEEPKYEDGIKWTSLRHNGPAFPPPYERLPDNIKFYYNEETVTLNSEAEEVASLYAKMLDHALTKDETFCKNFFTDWKDIMSPEVKEIITALDQCDFREMAAYYKRKKTNEKVQQEFGYFFLDGHKQRIGNYNISPPSLFVGRNSPNRGKLKKKILPEDVTINCSEKEIPEPPSGHRWGQVQHNPAVIWLASWKESPPGKVKYMMPHASSKLMGEKDWKKYEVVRSLKHHRDQIQEQYRKDWDSEDKSLRQRGVVLYLIDKFGFRVGNKTKEGMTANTFGCCSLRVKHVTLHEDQKGETKKVEFNFMGKSSVLYKKTVPVEEKVFRNLQQFKEEKGERGEADLFDQVNFQVLNMYLKGLKKGLTTKVFRTLNACITMEQQLKNLTDHHIKNKVSFFNEANRKVAELLNHQRTKTELRCFELQDQIEASRDELSMLKIKLERATQDSNTEELRNDVKRKEDELRKLDVKSRMEENKQLNLNSSKLYYIDPRIIVAWCIKWGVPVEEIYTEAQRDKFAWAIHMNNENFEF
ncbi:DNA topoisomerase 1-like [Trachemys scripta elegans]|uniref:DNA topoisomerase 1-like n=1 Tax=Trachemys scripta elegans TaxID=31138 RepID=UPI0015576B1E|nr:DNA topoisomerase 1-like [Trachemys scripta elegans]